VWTIPTQPFLGAHFATMPAAMAKRCLLAGTSAKGCCQSCGAPWEGKNFRDLYRPPKALGWKPGCQCEVGEAVPCTVLDPFGGAGTTALAAQRLGCHAVLIEIKPEYCEMARRRIVEDLPLLADVSVE
jgi:hypothetical protein